MTDNEMEICGFIDVKLTRNKYITHSVKKRSLTPWKTWKRQWCSVKKLAPGLGVEVQFNCCVSSDITTLQHEKHNFITISPDAIICRIPSRSKQFTFGIFPNKERKPLLYLSGNSESETQQWMTNIRRLLKPRRYEAAESYYDISLIDNTHSRAAGLTGLYGDLIVDRTGIFIKDAHTGEITENFSWKEFDQFHLTTAGRPEDVKRICVICTTKDFRAGVGELYVFCLEAGKLLQDLVTRGRGPKRKLLNHKSMSLSEGDLRIPADSNECTQNLSISREKNASSLLNVRQEAMPMKEIKEPKSSSNGTFLNSIRMDSSHEHPMKTSQEDILSAFNRRVSNVSVASGIYEEILDDTDVSKPIRTVSNLYEDPQELIVTNINADFEMRPPPLPPRQRFGSVSTENSSNSDDGSESTKETETIPSSMGAVPMPENKGNSNPQQIAIDSSDYIPMSPRTKDTALYSRKKYNVNQEDGYVVMR